MAKIERTKNASRNILFGIALQLYRVVVPFLMRTAIIYFLGIQYLGLSSLFTSVLQVLNLAELGVGSAMVYSMYKPIAEDDNATICALMKLYRKYYRIIGLVIAAVGLIICPFIPRLITGTVPDNINIYVLYLLNLGATVLSYWLFAYKNSLLTAHQRNDVISKISIITDSIQYVLQILVLWLVRNYYIFVVITLITQVLNNIVTAIYVDRVFPGYKPEGDLGKQEVKKINQRIRDLFSAKFGTVLSTSVDTIVISAGIGLTALAIYQNYFYIMNAVVVIIQIIFNSVRAGVGNSLIVENEEKNYKDFNKLTFIILWISVVCISCLLNGYQPFMKIWVHDTSYMLPFYMVILFCLYFYLVLVQNLSCTYKDAAGIWHEDRFRPLIAGLFNLTLNILLVRRYGLVGIILSTIISHLLIAMPWVINNLFKLVFKRSPKEFLLMIIKGFLGAAFSAAISWLLCSLYTGEGIGKLAFNLFISVVVSNIVLLACYRKTELFRTTVGLIKHIIHK